MGLELDAADLARAFGHEITSYDVEPIDPHLRFHSVTGGVFRVRAGDGSIVVKVVRHGVDDDAGALWVSGAEPSHRNYWKREWLAFDSGLLDALPGRLRAPRTLLTTQPSDDECWIWMEDVHGRIGTQLALDDYAAIGFDLGTTQGAFASGAVALPHDEWLSRRWLRSWVETNAARLTAAVDPSVWDDPRLAPLRPLRARAQAVWQRSEALLDIVESAPKTLLHLDFWPTNLAAATDGSSVAIDWSQVGLGGIAQDLDGMTLDPMWMQVRPETDPRELERLVIGGYVAGLRAAGFDADEASVWRCYAAAGSVRYLPMLELQAHVVADAEKVAAQETRFGWPFAEVLATRARLLERVVELGEQACS